MTQLPAPPRPHAAPRTGNVELASLLGRALRPLDHPSAQFLLAGRRILITGAGGSIGGALARQIAAFAPARLGLLDHSEYALWRVVQDISTTHPAQPIIASIRDATRLRAILESFRPDLVFHAAALKHVPLVQDHPTEGLLTNTIGTRHLIDAARAAGVQTLILVSTDKAVAPRSVMGASKRLAEMYGQATDIAAQGRAEALRCVSLRLGNVLGSAGSVMEIFARQLAQGGPLTLTHPDMTRYFIAPEEAVALLLATAALCTNHEPPPGAILVPDMGAPIRIQDLACRMILAAGLRPGQDISLQFTQPRAGEKLTEQSCHGAEPIQPTPCPGLMAVTPHTADLALAARAFDELEAACHLAQAGDDPHLALTLVSRLIPGFDHRPEDQANRRRA